MKLKKKKKKKKKRKRGAIFCLQVSKQVKGLFSFTCFCFWEWVCILKTAYPFVKHIPIAIVMSISHFRSCAGMCRGKASGHHFPFSVC